MKKIFLSLAGAALAAVVLVAGCKPRQPEEMLNKFCMDLSDKLKLNDAQKQMLFAMRDTAAEKGRTLQQEQEKMRQDLKKLLLSEKIDVNEVKTRGREKQEEIGRFFDLMAERLAEFHATLTPGQKQQLVEIIEKKKGRVPPWHR